MPGEFLSFFIILLAGLVFSTLFNRLHLPWVVALIVAGIIVGPHGLQLVKITPTLEFLGEIGLVFLMFMAGLETKLSDLRQIGKGVAPLVFLNGFVPFLVAFYRKLFRIRGVCGAYARSSLYVLLNCSRCSLS